jgi:hypothetical protein
MRVCTIFYDYYCCYKRQLTFLNGAIKVNCIKRQHTVRAVIQFTYILWLRKLHALVFILSLIVWRLRFGDSVIIFRFAAEVDAIIGLINAGKS